MEHVVELDLCLPVCEVHIGIGLLSYSGVAEVHVVPFLDVILVGDSLPLVGGTGSLQVGVVVGGKGKDVLGLVSTNPEAEHSISQASDISVVLSIVDGESESTVPGLLVVDGAPLEPPTH